MFLIAERGPCRKICCLPCFYAMISIIRYNYQLHALAIREAYLNISSFPLFENLPKYQLPCCKTKYNKSWNDDLSLHFNFTCRQQTNVWCDKIAALNMAIANCITFFIKGIHSILVIYGERVNPKWYGGSPSDSCHVRWIYTQPVPFHIRDECLKVGKVPLSYIPLRATEC